MSLSGTKRHENPRQLGLAHNLETPMDRTPFYYLHDNGQLIFKPHADACDLQDSDLVRTYWTWMEGARGCAWTIALEALAAGAGRARIQELADRWGLTDLDATEYAKRVGVVLTISAAGHTATVRDGKEHGELAPVGHGATYLDAMANLCNALGYMPTNPPHSSFITCLEAERLEVSR